MTTPPGWTHTTLGALGRYVNGRGFKKQEWATSGRPIIRIQNLTGTNDQFNYYPGDDVPDDQVARSGDLLISWAATLGAYIWSGPESVINQHIFKVDSRIDVRFHKYLLDHKLSALMRETHGSGMVHITRRRFEAIPVDLPPPTVQRRTVEILEDQLSRIDAAASLLDAARGRLTALERSALAEACDGALVPLAEVADIQGGIQKQPKRAPRRNAYPFLRVANVTANGLDLNEVHRIELFGDELSRLRLAKGDLLVVEGNGSASQVGRAALWDASIPECVHQNHLIRVRARSGLVPEYLEAAWNAPRTRAMLTAIASSTSGLHTLSVSKLARLPIPVPSPRRQREALERLNSLRAARAELAAEVRVAAKRAYALKRSLLAAAFSGRLTGWSSDYRLNQGMEGV